MQWDTGFWGEQEMVNLANAILNAKTKSVSEVQQASESASPDPARGDQGKAGSGKGSEKAEEV